MKAAREILARFGGSKTIQRPFVHYRTIGDEEMAAVRDVMESGILSAFVGTWHEDFEGGPRVRDLEHAAREWFGVRHAITVNSWTSGLIASVGAVGIEPGDEVIVPPWTMSASATAILHWNAIPVFADIEPETFCLDPDSVRSNLSPYTRAILSVDIFGQSADMDALQALADDHSLKLICDAAQAPGARVGSRFAGTLGDVGGYSLNYHKHIHTGEGGIVVTDDDDIADRVMLIRNHAEAVIGPKGQRELHNLLGYNFRLGELEGAIGIEQLSKLEARVASRQRAAARLSRGLSGLEGLTTPVVRDACTHVYYVYPLILDVAGLGVCRTDIVEALKAEGVPGLMAGYQNLHLLPMYQRKIAYGRGGFPWTSEICRRDVSYAPGICPVAERLHHETFFGILLCSYEFLDEDIDLVIEAFHKVWGNLDALVPR